MSRARRRRLIVSALATLGLVAATMVLADAVGVAQQGTAAGTARADLPRTAPPLAGATLEGGTADLDQLRGRVVVVTVWASWCPPCREELPVLAQTERRYAGAGVTFLGILTRDTPTSATALLTQTKATQLSSVLDPDGTIAVTWGATGVPETYIVDRSGLVTARTVGPVTGPWLQSQIDPLVGG